MQPIQNLVTRGSALRDNGSIAVQNYGPDLSRLGWYPQQYDPFDIPLFGFTQDDGVTEVLRLHR